MTPSSSIGPVAEARSAEVSAASGRTVRRFLDVAHAGLPRMWRKELGCFAHTRRLAPEGSLLLEGASVRYTAITALGAAALDESAQRPLFGGETAAEWLDRALGDAPLTSNAGDAALLLWAAALLRHERTGEAIDHLLRLDRSSAPRPTIEAAWALSALVAAAEIDERPALAEPLAAAHARLIGAAHESTGLFPHRLGAGGPRSHVASFADQVYPIQALARFARLSGDGASLDAAERCGRRICALQGQGGQWWWHYDVRTGRVVEGYPVYSVHQDAMGPMALLDLRDAGGEDRSEAIARGVRWMERAPEIDRSLIDEERAVIWRKVWRGDPWKLVRTSRAVATRLSPALSLGVIDRLFRPTHIDFECRPYHLGWILFTWGRGKRGMKE